MTVLREVLKEQSHWTALKTYFPASARYWASWTLELPLRGVASFASPTGVRPMCSFHASAVWSCWTGSLGNIGTYDVLGLSTKDGVDRAEFQAEPKMPSRQSLRTACQIYPSRPLGLPTKLGGTRPHKAKPRRAVHRVPVSRRQARAPLELGYLEFRGRGM